MAAAAAAARAGQRRVTHRQGVQGGAWRPATAASRRHVAALTVTPRRAGVWPPTPTVTCAVVVPRSSSSGTTPGGRSPSGVASPCVAVVPSAPPSRPVLNPAPPPPLHPEWRCIRGGAAAVAAAITATVAAAGTAVRRRRRRGARHESRRVAGGRASAVPACLVVFASL